MCPSRRRFFYLAGLTTLGAAISACQTSSTPVSPPSPTPAGNVTLQGGDADVWAWEKQVHGQIKGADCSTIEVITNQRKFPAALEGFQFMANIPIEEGENKVSAGCQPGRLSSDALIYTGMLRSVPRSVIEIRLENGRIILDGSKSQPAPMNGTPVTKYSWSARTAIGGKSLNGENSSLEIDPPTVDGEYYISLQVTDDSGRTDTSTTYFVVSQGKPRLDDWTWQNTAWVDDAVVYGVIPGRFGRKGFQSITERLDKLQELGITALWLAPIFPSPPYDYGYAVMDYFNLREEYGTKDDFRKLVQEAHKRSIRILMDFVPNHSSDQHPYFQSALKMGKGSPYWDFYARDENGEPTHYFNWTNLPNLNYDNPEVRQWMTEAFSYWVREFDVDGFRVDAAWGIRERRPDFWPEWRATLKRIKPDLLLLAEAGARDEYYFTNGFDAAYDWTDQLGHWAWEKVFEKETLLTYNLNTALTNNRKGFDQDALIFRFLNNNDTGERFLTKYGPEMNRVANIMLLTLPGIPCIYTGDEVGAEYEPYGDNPLPIIWQDKQGMSDFFKKIITLRHQTPALHSRNWQIVEVEPHQQLYGYLRYIENGKNPVLVLLNFLDKPATAEVKLPEEFGAFASTGKLHDLLSGETIDVGNSLTIEMQPMGARILSV